MAEQLVNEFTVNRPIDEAWAVITDVERIAPCMPGAQLQEIEGDVYRGIVKIKLGSITPQFKGQASFVQRDDSAHTATLKAEGRDTGGRGNASAEIAAQAESLSPTSTRVVVTTDLHITGKVAQFGRGIIGDVSKKLMAQFAGNLNTMLDAEPVTTNGDAAGGTTTSRDAAGAGVSEAAGAAAVESPPPASALGADVPRPEPGAAAAAATTEAPRVRKVDSPATEPVDLSGMAGPAILKRLLPVLAGLVLLVLILRRRRH
jgi:carbon monoxide dehydrogenase subunit G